MICNCFSAKDGKVFMLIIRPITEKIPISRAKIPVILVNGRSNI
jgi:hypothetical protein